MQSRSIASHRARPCLWSPGINQTLQIGPGSRRYCPTIHTIHNRRRSSDSNRHCGTVSSTAWPDLQRLVDACVTVSSYESHCAVQSSFGTGYSRAPSVLRRMTTESLLRSELASFDVASRVDACVTVSSYESHCAVQYLTSKAVAAGPCGGASLHNPYHP
jgi:hypothetical protein